MEPLRTSYSRDEIIAHAKAFLLERLGKRSDCQTYEELERWHTRLDTGLGLLVNFLHDRFPADNTAVSANAEHCEVSYPEDSP